MSVLTELHNDWREAVEAAQNLATDGDQGAFERAWGAAEESRRKYENAEKASAATRALDERKPAVADLRNPADASDVATVTADVANGSPKGFIELAKNVYVPFASRNCEGFIRNSPAAVQLPSIMARYEPGGELFHEAQWQRRAFDIFMRKGEPGVRAEAMKMGGSDGQHLLRGLAALQEGTDSEGGYLVPADERMELIHDPGVPGGVMRPISRAINTSRDGGTFPSATTITWGAIAEEATPSDTDPVFAQVPFTIRKSGVNMLLSEELLADSAVNLPTYIGNIVRETSGRYEDQQGIEGDGSTEPLGLRTTGAPQGNISDITDLLTLAQPTLQEITSAYFELPAQFRGSGAAWYATSSFMARVVGGITASGGQLWLLPNGSDRPGFTMLGLPVVMFDGTGWDDAAAITANEEVGAIGNFNYYWFIDRLGTVIRRDDSVNFKSDQIAFKARKRYDSMFALPAAFRILKAAAA